MQGIRSLSNKFDSLLTFFTGLAVHIKNNNNITINIKGDFIDHSIIGRGHSTIVGSSVSDSQSIYFVEKIQKQIVSQETKMVACVNGIKQLKEIMLGIILYYFFRLRKQKKI